MRLLRNSTPASREIPKNLYRASMIPKKYNNVIVSKTETLRAVGFLKQTRHCAGIMYRTSGNVSKKVWYGV